MKKYSFLLIASIALAACGDKTNTQTTNNETTTNQEPTTTPAAVDSAAIMKPQIEQLLNSYYADLCAENIDENKYFTPMVSTFFASQNISASKIGESLRQGFKTMDNRKVTINPANTVVVKTATGYEVEITGTSEHTDVKTKKQIKGDFHNRIVLDNHLKISAYSQALSGDRGLNIEEETEVAFAEKILANLNSPNAIEQFMDSEKGALYMYRKGVFDNIVVAKNYAELKSANQGVAAELKTLGCKSIEMKEVSFDCDKEFSAKGCFLFPVNGYNDFTKKTAELNKIKGGIKTYSAKEISAEKEMETMVTHELIITEKHLLLGIGKINGKWRVITIDAAKFDCSA